MKDSFLILVKSFYLQTTGHVDNYTFIVITIRNHIYLPWSFSNIELVNISIKNII